MFPSKTISSSSYLFYFYEKKGVTSYFYLSFSRWFMSKVDSIHLFTLWNIPHVYIDYINKYIAMDPRNFPQSKKQKTTKTESYLFRKVSLNYHKRVLKTLQIGLDVGHPWGEFFIGNNWCVENLNWNYNNVKALFGRLD